MALTPTPEILSSSTLAILLLLLLLLHPSRNLLTLDAASGKWDLLQPTIGIVGMHMQLLHTDRVVIYDRTDYGRSNISLPDGKCRPDDYVVKPLDCTAHSVEYDVSANSVRPLMVLTDVWCSSGAVMPDGTLVQAGGFRNGDHVVRLFKPCRDNTCDWHEIGAALAQRRWYSTSQILPGGTQIIVGGRQQFNYEFYPKTGSSDKAYNLPFLVQTNDKLIENNLYPFVFLNLDGNLFVFANNRAILFDYKNDKVVRTYPEIPGGDPRSYPSTGSAVLLPLKDINNVSAAEVLVCGGSPKGSFIQAQNHSQFVDALDTCGRIGINDVDPKWAMDTMPSGRVMGDMLLLPDGNVLIINGAGAGTAGWELGRNPVLEPVVYRPDSPVGSRFEVQNPSTIPRMYHSSAVLLRDGRVLVGGSNPHVYYNFTGVLYPTELSLESFSPSYLDPSFADLRPTIISPVSQSKIGYGQQVPIRFTINSASSGILDSESVMVTMVAPSFTTHSFAMNQRLLVLTRLELKAVGNSTYEAQVVTPKTDNLAPSGYYLVFVVHQNIPSEAIWVHIQ